MLWTRRFFPGFQGAENIKKCLVNPMPLQPLHRNDLLPGLVPLGFGSGWLQAGQQAAHSLQTLEAALNSGFNYFDTARLYGDGQSEALLGKVLSPHRHKLVITSKAGIHPIDISVFGKLKRKCLKSAREPEFGRFSAHDLTQSIDTSLRELHTDYLDILLLHECTLAHLQKYDVQPTLEKLKAAGKIRHYGIATSLEESLKIIEKFPALTSVVQIPSSALDRNISRLPPRDSLTVIHSVIAPSLPAFVDCLATHGTELEHLLGIALDAPETAGQLLLAHALHTNPSGIVLFFSKKIANIQRAADIVQQQRFTPAQLTALSRFLAQRLTPATPD
jgi:diketogulonate reductase-like aldo/keto reductase